MLVSSKTLAELEDYARQLDLAHPVVAENGAVLSVPTDYFPGMTSLLTTPVSRECLQSAYREAKAANAYHCEAFYELGEPGIARATGLDLDQARRANTRAGSEPILWLDDASRADSFVRDMEARGLHCVQGGRFLHLMGKTGKEDAVRQLMAQYAHKWPGKKLISVSLGDGPNDLGMLASTDIAVLIPGKHEHRMTLNSNNRVLTPSSPGPTGWNEAMMSLLAEPLDELHKTPQ